MLVAKIFGERYVPPKSLDFLALLAGTLCFRTGIHLKNIAVEVELGTISSESCDYTMCNSVTW